jgi:uncharacterized protein
VKEVVKRMKSEEEIIQIIQTDKWMIDILYAVKSLNLPDWWVCAGFVRSKIWDVLHDFEEKTPNADVDVIYFDPNNLNEQVEKDLEEKLKKMLPTIPWSVKNEARMHEVNNLTPYTSSEDAISKFPETVTSLGLKLDDFDEVILTAPHGIHDVINFTIKPTPFFKETKERMAIYRARIQKKNWQDTWEKVKILEWYERSFK